MDPATLSAAVVGVNRHSYTLAFLPLNIQSSRQNDYRLKIDAERKRTDAWANEVRSINIKDPRETFPAKEHHRILDTLEELRQSYKQASRKLDTIDKGEISLQRQDLLDDVYNDLEELLNNLISANDALQQIARNHSTYSSRALEKSPERPRELTPERKVTDMVPIHRSIRPPHIPPMRTIYDTTHSTLVTISVRRADPKISRSASRLKLWGAGLFEMAIPLDTVFDSNGDAFQPVRQSILRILVDILVWAEQELNKLGSDGYNPERYHDGPSAEQITALLGTDELIPMALESWRDSVAQYQYIQAGHVFNTKYNPVPGLVEILFDLLPAVRGTRSTYCSRLIEAENLEDDGATALLRQPAALRSIRRTPGSDLSNWRSPTTTQHSTSEEPMFDESYVRSANLKFEKVDSIFRKLDKIAKRESPYTSRLQNVKESFNGFYDDRRNRRGVDTMASDDIIEKQKMLDKRLAEFIKDSSDISSLSDPIRRVLKKRQEKDVEKQVKRADSLLSFLTDTDRSMRNMIRPGS